MLSINQSHLKLSWRNKAVKQMKATTRFVTAEETKEASRRCKEFFDEMAVILIASGEPLKVMPNFPSPESSSIAYSCLSYPIPPKIPASVSPPIRIKISAHRTSLNAYLEFYPKDDDGSPGSKRLLEEILLQLWPDQSGFSHDFYDESPISPESATIKLLGEARVMRNIYEKHRQVFGRVYQKELDFTAELYTDEAEKIIQNIRES